MIQIINISLIPSDNKPVINVSQYDNGLRVLRFNIFDDIDMEVPHEFDGETVTCNIRKNDNNIVVITGTIETEITEETETSFVEVVLTEQACACVGSNYGEISLSSGDDVIGTCNFKLVVERSPLTGGVDSQSEIDNLTTQIEDIAEQVIGEDYYTKTETDNLLDGKANITDLPDMSDYYTKTETDNLLDGKANITDLPDMSDYYTKTETDNKIVGLIDDSVTVNDKTWSSEKISEELINILPTGTASGSIANFNTALNLPLYIEAEFDAALEGVSEVKLGYVNFNQLVDYSLITNLSQYNVSITVTNIITITTNGTASNTVYKNLSNFPTTLNHKYLIVGSKNEVTDLAFFDNSTPRQFNNLYTETIINGSGANISFYMRVNSGGVVNTEINPLVIDLTQVFGEQIANYLYSLPDNGLRIVKQLLTKDYYSYNIGGSIVTLNSVNGVYTCPAENISLGSTYYNGGKVTIDKEGHRTLTADGQTITLLDGQPIIALVGNNNVYCDTGDTTVQYKDTINNYIDTRVQAVNAVSNRSLSLSRNSNDTLLGAVSDMYDRERGETDDQK